MHKWVDTPILMKLQYFIHALTMVHVASPYFEGDNVRTNCLPGRHQADFGPLICIDRPSCREELHYPLVGNRGSDYDMEGKRVCKMWWNIVGGNEQRKNGYQELKHKNKMREGRERGRKGGRERGRKGGRERGREGESGSETDRQTEIENLASRSLRLESYDDNENASTSYPSVVPMYRALSKAVTHSTYAQQKTARMQHSWQRLR